MFWPAARPYVLLTVLTFACLIPFCNKAFHVDDTLFLWSAQQIAKEPLDPFGFDVVWYNTTQPMSDVTKNPPLAAYYLAAVAAVTGWSEIPLHLAFLLFAVAAILGTYSLAKRFTANPFLAAAATLLTPALLVSSTSVMCDTMMLAFWILAIILWLEGLDRSNRWLLAGSGLIIAVCALTKYFGVALIPLLFAYTLARERRIGKWAWYFLIPVAALIAYQLWTIDLYQKGLLSDAGEYARNINRTGGITKVLIGLSFAGGCALPAITFIPLVWPLRKVIAGAVLAAMAGFAFAKGWIAIPFEPAAHAHWYRLIAQFTLFVAGGVAILALAFADWWKRRDADSVLLGLWVIGTLCFATYLNWTVNARSMLPLIPAAGILLARRIDQLGPFSRGMKTAALCLPLLLSGAVSIWVAAADAKLAGSARQAAQYIRDHPFTGAPDVIFQGHWGFQYYMQAFGFHPFDFRQGLQDGTVMIVPENSANTRYPPKQFIQSTQIIGFDANAGVLTIGWSAGFYSDFWGPLPYVFGSVPQERYAILRLAKNGNAAPPE